MKNSPKAGPSGESRPQTRAEERAKIPFPARISRREEGKTDLGNLWVEIRWRLREGEFPSEVLIADAIRRDPSIPLDLAEYVANRMVRTVKRPAHRPPESLDDRMERLMRAVSMHCDVVGKQDENRRNGVKNPRGTALHSVAKKHHLSAETVRSIIRRELDPQLREILGREALRKYGTETPD